MSENRKIAVMVGINSYDQPISSLKYTVNDAKALHKILVDSERGNYQPEWATLMTNGSERETLPTRNNIMSKIDHISRGAEVGDSILFAFSGHGMEEDGTSYLLPLDAKAGILVDTAISLKWIRDKLSQSRATAKILILDACHSGARLDKANLGPMSKRFSDEILEFGEGFAVLSSCKLDEVSYELPGKEHGVYSYYLLEGLKGEADKDRDGHITISEANQYVTRRVRSWALSNNRLQTPTLEYKVSGDIILVHVPETVIPQPSEIIDEKEKLILSVSFFKIYSTPLKEPLPQDTTEYDYAESRVEALEDAREATRSEASEYSREFVNTLCAKLLAYYKATEISHKQNIYHFPDGKIIIQTSDDFDNQQVLSEVRLTVDFVPSRKDLLNSLLLELSNYHWESLEFTFKKPLDTNRLIDLLSKSNMTIESFDPSGASPLVASAPGWGTPRTSAVIYFHNLKDSSQVRIHQGGVGSQPRLEYGFYEKLSAKSMVEFFYPAFRQN